MGSVTPARYADCALPSPPGPSKAPSPMVFPLLLPIVSEPPGPPERMGLGCGLRGWTAASTSAVIMTACVSREALWARPDRGDLSQCRACSGAPLADQGKIRAGENACLEFSQMR